MEPNKNVKQIKNQNERSVIKRIFFKHACSLRFVNDRLKNNLQLARKTLGFLGYSRGKQTLDSWVGEIITLLFLSRFFCFIASSKSLLSVRGMEGRVSSNLKGGACVGLKARI